MEKKILQSTAHHSLVASGKSFYIILVILCTFMGATIEAAAYGAELHLSVWNSNAFTVELDGKRYQADDEFIADHLSSGAHKMRVTQSGSNHFSNGPSSGILYQGTIRIKDNTISHAFINEYGYLEIVIEPLYGTSVSYNDYHNGSASSQPYHPASAQHVNECDNPAHVSASAITQQELDRMKDRMNDAFTDDDRLMVAKQAIERVRISSDQVKQLMDEFWFEKNRLEFAKFAYTRVSDPFNFYVVNDAFWFSTSIRELDEYIHQRS